MGVFMEMPLLTSLSISLSGRSRKPRVATRARSGGR